MTKAIFYKKQIIKQLYFSASLSCSDLSLQLHKSLPLTTKMVNELLEEDVIVESGYAPSTGGRRPLMYSLRPDVLYVVSVAMDQLFTRIVIMDMQQHQVAECERFELHLEKNPQALEILADRISGHIQRSEIRREKIAGIGIGMPGFVDAGKGINYSFLESKGRTITQFLQDRLKAPVYIENDSSLIALAEYRFGAARDKESAMVINLGWGIGLGLVMNGKLFRGHEGFAGEFSHIPLFSNNKLCSCGKSGCLETEASLLVVVEKARAGIGEGKLTILKSELLMNDPEEASMAVIRAAEKGDKFAVELLSEAGYHIGRGVAILIHLLNPEAVVLSGRGSIAGKVWRIPLQQALNEHCIPRLSHNTTIEVSGLGKDAELTGAAALVMDNYEKSTIKKTQNTVQTPG